MIPWGSDVVLETWKAYILLELTATFLSWIYDQSRPRDSNCVDLGILSTTAHRSLTSQQDSIFAHSTCHNALAAQYLWQSGFFCGWPDGLELSPRQFTWRKHTDRWQCLMLHPIGQRLNKSRTWKIRAGISWLVDWFYRNLNVLVILQLQRKTRVITNNQSVKLVT